ncbi:MAG: 5'-methylthioadenosine/S-adenosylhomocysteine nucleosidase [Ruminococcaceae bacterium]|nr:5'-methylthioadenosine/S-adenosylhomocysteine nucleosidase [Oscillospiraceae bacterium]
MSITVGAIFADSMEYAPFLDWAKTQKFTEGSLFGNDCVEVEYVSGGEKMNIIAVKCGIGKVNAAAATAYLIGTRNVDCVVNAGLSGAVSGLKREDMIAGESYIECDFDLTAIGYAPGEKCDGQKSLLSADERLLSYALKSEGIMKAKCGTGDIFLSDKEKKEFFKNTFSIQSFDMETGAIASVCDKAGVPMLSLRKISDDADDSSVEDYREMNDRKESCLTELLVNIFTRMLADNFSGK